MPEKCCDNPVKVAAVPLTPAFDVAQSKEDAADCFERVNREGNQCIEACNPKEGWEQLQCQADCDTKLFGKLQRCYELQLCDPTERLGEECRRNACWLATSIKEQKCLLDCANSPQPDACGKLCRDDAVDSPGVFVLATPKRRCPH